MTWIFKLCATMEQCALLHVERSASTASLDFVYLHRSMDERVLATLVLLGTAMAHALIVQLPPAKPFMSHKAVNVSVFARPTVRCRKVGMIVMLSFCLHFSQFCLQEMET
jgi:hypothetical protein